MTTVSKLESLGFVEADGEPKRRLLVSVRGLEKTGKTHFSLTAPGPIAFFDLDMGTEGVVSKFQALGKKILLNKVTPDMAETEWPRFKEAFRAALASRQIKTIVWDTETEVWELVRLCKFGKLTQVMPYHYGPVNNEYRKLLRETYDSGKNLILLHKMKPKYIDDKRTREYERAGFNDIGFIAQVNAIVYRDPTDEGGEFNLEILDCRQNSDAAGEVLLGEMASFPYLASLAFPDTNPGDWE